jgi:hypothetical protein
MYVNREISAHKFLVLHSVAGCAVIFSQHVVEDRWNDQRTNAQCKQRCRSLRNGDVEELLKSIDTSEEERHAQDEQQVGKHTADQ